MNYRAMSHTIQDLAHLVTLLPRQDRTLLTGLLLRSLPISEQYPLETHKDNWRKLQAAVEHPDSDVSWVGFEQRLNRAQQRD